MVACCALLPLACYSRYALTRKDGSQGLRGECAREVIICTCCVRCEGHHGQRARMLLEMQRRRLQGGREVNLVAERTTETTEKQLTAARRYEIKSGRNSRARTCGTESGGHPHGHPTTSARDRQCGASAARCHARCPRRRLSR
jgi:hypothetical protein